MKFNPSEKMSNAADAIMEHAAKLNRGDVLDYDSMEIVSGIGREDLAWRPLMEKIKKRFVRDRGIVLYAEPTVGYRLLTHEEQLRDNPYRRARKGQRQFWFGTKETNSIPDSELTTKQREVKIFSKRKMERARKDGLNAARDIAATKFEARPINKKPKPLK